MRSIYLRKIAESCEGQWASCNLVCPTPMSSFLSSYFPHVLFFSSVVAKKTTAHNYRKNKSQPQGEQNGVGVASESFPVNYHYLTCLVVPWKTLLAKLSLFYLTHSSSNTNHLFPGSIFQKHLEGINFVAVWSTGKQLGK